MIGPRNWTPEDTELIKTRRAQRKTWEEIAAELQCSRHMVAQYAKQNGLWTGSLPSLKHVNAEAMDPNRLPLPPGHEISWGSITHGTLLHGVPYPL